ncbi:hypothetical protein KC351_g52 [Hortaea werneckii]|nr:hypothetical protein KC351_g52 [Hortaea werneckii]
MSLRSCLASSFEIFSTNLSMVLPWKLTAGNVGTSALRMMMPFLICMYSPDSKHICIAPLKIECQLKTSRRNVSKSMKLQELGSFAFSIFRTLAMPACDKLERLMKETTKMCCLQSCGLEEQSSKLLLTEKLRQQMQRAKAWCPLVVQHLKHEKAVVRVQC